MKMGVDQMRDEAALAPLHSSSSSSSSNPPFNQHSLKSSNHRLKSSNYSTLRRTHSSSFANPNSSPVHTSIKLANPNSPAHSPIKLANPNPIAAGSNRSPQFPRRKHHNDAPDVIIGVELSAPVDLRRCNSSKPVLIHRHHHHQQQQHQQHHQHHQHQQHHHRRHHRTRIHEADRDDGSQHYGESTAVVYGKIDGYCDAAIRSARAAAGKAGLGLKDFKPVKRLGHGDASSVYLVELKANYSSHGLDQRCLADQAADRSTRPSRCLFAMKMMDKELLDQGPKSSSKLGRFHTERDILRMIDHPFLPTLYADFETERFACVLIDFCCGGDLHTLRQRQPLKRFSEPAARFYVAEVLLALEYLHMKGVIYRDLKPENILIREDGHIMLSDFDLSLQCTETEAEAEAKAVGSPMRKSSGKARSSEAEEEEEEGSKEEEEEDSEEGSKEDSEEGGLDEDEDEDDKENERGGDGEALNCMQPSCTLFAKGLMRMKTMRKKAKMKAKMKARRSSEEESEELSEMKKVVGRSQVRPLPEEAAAILVEPTGARSMSFVGTYEYIAPEVIAGDGHGAAVDWWALGILLHELLFGFTPFKGVDHKATLMNIVGDDESLKFPAHPNFRGSAVARDLIRALLAKVPERRLGFSGGAADIRRHPFFKGINWALVRTVPPPEIPPPFRFSPSLAHHIEASDFFGF